MEPDFTKWLGNNNFFKTCILGRRDPASIVFTASNFWTISKWCWCWDATEVSEIGTAPVWNLACVLLSTRDVLRQSKKFPGATAWWDFDGKICRSGRAASADSSLPRIAMFCISSPWLWPLVSHIQPYPFIIPKALLLRKKSI